MGAYGDGDALKLLKGQTPPLIDLAWISSSRGYPGTSQFHVSDEWQLFQNWTDSKWFSQLIEHKCGPGLGLDTDIQNMKFAGEEIGFWNRQGPYKVPIDRTNAIYTDRRFACNGDALIRATDQLPPGELARTDRCGRSYVLCEPKLPRGLVAQICFGQTVRVGTDNGTLVQIDYDDDGTFDGWTRITNLTKSFATKPVYIPKDSQRRAAVCPEVTF